MSGRVVGVLLAGGQARRMGGGDKCLTMLDGAPLLQRVIERVQNQVDALVLNANGDPARFTAFGLPTVADVVEGYAGPLAGVLSGMAWARRHAPETRWVASFATDTPFVPTDLVARMVAAVAAPGTDLATVSCDGRAQPVFGLWPVALADDLRRSLEDEGVRKVDAWTARWRCADVGYAGAGQPFFNINRPEDLVTAGKLLERAGSGPAGGC